MRLICILGGTSSSGADDTSTVYETGPSFPQPGPQFPQPSLRYPPVIPPVVPPTTGFEGPFIPPQAFPQGPGFPQPQAFPQPITVTTLPPRMPPFPLDRPVHSQIVKRQTRRVGQFLYLQIFRLQVVTVQATLVQRIQCHPLQFLDHTQQTSEEKLFTFHLALLVQMVPVQIHIGGVVLNRTPEGMTLK